MKPFLKREEIACCHVFNYYIFKWLVAIILTKRQRGRTYNDDLSTTEKASIAVYKGDCATYRVREELEIFIPDSISLHGVLNDVS